MTKRTTSKNLELLTVSQAHKLLLVLSKLPPVRQAQQAKPRKIKRKKLAKISPLSRARRARHGANLRATTARTTKNSLGKTLATASLTAAQIDRLSSQIADAIVKNLSSKNAVSPDKGRQILTNLRQEY